MKSKCEWNLISNLTVPHMVSSRFLHRSMARGRHICLGLFLNELTENPANGCKVLRCKVSDSMTLVVRNSIYSKGVWSKSPSKVASESALAVKAMRFISYSRHKCYQFYFHGRVGATDSLEFGLGERNPSYGPSNNQPKEISLAARRETT